MTGLNTAGMLPVWITGAGIVIYRTNPDLFAERLGSRRGGKSWDTIIMSLLGIVQLGRYIIVGLVQRNSWSGEFSFSSQFVALVLCILGYALVVWATYSNAFFSQNVRLQPERSQKVIMDGPYRFLRHPAYVGALLFELVVSILLGSWWSMIASGITVVLLIIRTALEDQTLQTELPGYPDYVKKVRFRIIPGVW
ncbi:MAG: isoprenylcysteine carboxylmethyltransferase family protein [Chloroflexi bacterium HGW-Chloroflexi-3]|nr:MAG: isoprenylcysteine carboxylmethyltransferase family protein [Chloroflexi bacterium HGW-Chloroflexi-3]